MKVIPKLLNTAMVKAVIAGHKTQTRVPLKPQPVKSGNQYRIRGKIVLNDPADMPLKFSPFGGPGDLLWVRETFSKDYLLAGQGLDGRPTEYIYRVDGEHYVKWTPSIHMPREASRITLKVEHVWVERIQDMNKLACIHEGIAKENGRWMDYRKGVLKQACLSDPVDSFRTLWDSIYGKPMVKNGPVYPWKDNPYVWCAKFSVIMKNVDEVLEDEKV